MRHKLVRDAVAKIFRAKMKTKMPSGVLHLCEDPEKDAILASMPKFSQRGLAGRDDHGPQKEKAKRARLPSSPEEEAEELESADRDGDEAGGESSGSEDDDDDDAATTATRRSPMLTETTTARRRMTTKRRGRGRQR